MSSGQTRSKGRTPATAYLKHTSASLTENQDVAMAMFLESGPKSRPQPD